MTDRCLDRVADDFVLARQSLAERDAAIARVRAHFDDDTPLDAVDVRTLLADHARARSLVTQLQERLRGEKHHHENDVQRLTAELEQLRAQRAAAHALTEPHPLCHWDTQWPIRAALEGMTAAEYAGAEDEQDACTASSGPTAQGNPGDSESTVDVLDVSEVRRTWTPGMDPFVVHVERVPPPQLHTLTTSCWCQPGTALDGHVNEDGSQPEFAATDADPVDADGFLLEELAR